jgi:hypothetical protein
MAKKLCFKTLKTVMRYTRLAFVFLGALTVGGVYFGGDVYALFGALLFTLAVWAVEEWMEGERE